MAKLKVILMHIMAKKRSIWGNAYEMILMLENKNKLLSGKPAGIIDI